MRSEHPLAVRALPALERMPLADAVRFALERYDTPWLPLALRSGAPPEDLGVFWVVLPGDALIWPVRVLMVYLEDESHAVWVTYDRAACASLEVFTQPGADRPPEAQAGEPGRVRLLSRPGTPAGHR